MPIFECLDWLLGRFARRTKVHPRRVLIVEDNPADAELLMYCLDANGLKGTITHTAEGARDLIARNHISIAFIDLRLPHMDGWELIPLIWRNSPHTLVVIVCGEISDVARIPRSEFRHVMMIQKPPSVDAMAALLRHVKLNLD